MTPSSRRSDDPARRGEERKRWLTIWVGLLAIFFLVPALLIAWDQRASRIFEARAWEATLDPNSPDPGMAPAENVPTDRARRVSIGFYLETMEEVSLHDSQWKGVLDVWCRWKDDADAPGGADFDPFDHLIAINGMITDRKVLREIHDGGEHFVLQRLSLTYTRIFRIVNFPLDRHLLLASFENSAHPRQDLLFVPDQEASAVSARVAMTGYRILRSHAVETAHSYQTSRGIPGASADQRGAWSQPRFAVVIDRNGWGLMLKMFQALFVSVAVALLACFIKPIHVDPRFGLGVGALFASVANSYLVGTYVPEGSEFSLADAINLLGIGTILVSLTQSTISLWIYESLGNQRLSRRFDRVSFWTILTAFLASLFLCVAGAVSRY
jgi:hypothetical protein